MATALASDAVLKELAALRPSWQQTMLRVKDPKRSVAYYTQNFNMVQLNEYHFGKGQGDFSLYFLATPDAALAGAALPAFGSPEAHRLVWDCRPGMHVLELTHNHGSEAAAEADMPVRDAAGRPQVYASGNDEPARGFGHIAFNCADVYAAAETLLAAGVAFKKKPDEGRMKGLAFALDPDGYWVEIVKSGPARETTATFNLSQTMMRIKDPAASVAFYKLFDMQVVEEKHFGPDKGDFSLFFLATPTPELAKLQASADVERPTKVMWDPVLELTHNHGTEGKDGPVYHNGNDTSYAGKDDVPKGFGHIGFIVDDLKRFCELLEQAGVPFIKRPQDGTFKDLAFVKDPTGYWIEVVQRNMEPFPETPLVAKQ